MAVVNLCSSVVEEEEEEDDPRMGVRGVRRHAEPLGDNDPPRLGETAGGGVVTHTLRALVSNVRLRQSRSS